MYGLSTLYPQNNMKMIELFIFFYLLCIHMLLYTSVYDVCISCACRGYTGQTIVLETDTA